jgi:hypothetical protein
METGSAAAPKLDLLEGHFVSGDMVQARKTATDILIDARNTCRTGTAKQKENPGCSVLGAIESSNHYWMVVWAGAGADDKPELHRLLSPQSKARPYALDLPGIGGSGSESPLYEVFIATHPKSTLVSAYASTRSENPINAQLIAFAQQVFTPLLSLVEAVARGGETKTAGALPPTLYVTVSSVVLPFERATMTVKSRATVSLTIEAATKIFADLGLKLSLGGFDQSGFARKLTASFVEAASQELARCKAGLTANGDCAGLSGRLDLLFATIFEQCKATCVPGSTPTDDDLKAMKGVDKAFRAVLESGLSQSVEADASLANTPATYFALGAVAGMLVSGTPDKARVTLDENGNLKADPLGRAVTMAVVNYAPRGYDAAEASPSKRERYRLFFGGVLTPDFGIGAGGSILIVRGLAINGGGGVLFSRGLKDGDEVGNAPKDPLDPFAKATTKFWFVGLSYNFK